MEIQKYWDQRASADTANATTNDIYLRVLERKTLIEELQRLGCGSESSVLDLGCGDGRTIEALSDRFDCKGTGLDFSQEMIQLAEERLSKLDHKKQLSFVAGDIRAVNQQFGGQQFDFVLTDRSLINIEDTAEQLKAIRDIAEIVRAGGYYLAIENFVEGNERLNELRGIFELPPIPVRWHNKFFEENSFIEEAQKHFSEVRKIDFSSAYYLATRVIYSKLCQIEGMEPDYRHPIHEFSVSLPQLGDFSPIKLFVMKK